MALPKRRHSKARGRKRRTHYKLGAKAMMECPNCGRPKQPHRICAFCGHYKGKEVIAITEKG